MTKSSVEAKALCLVMWSTDVLHHVHPTTISLVAVLVLFCPVTNLMPGIGSIRYSRTFEQLPMLYI